MRIVLPACGLVHRYTELSAPLFGRFNANLTESGTLAAIRDALLPKLLSGQIRVQEAERVVAEVV